MRGDVERVVMPADHLASREYSIRYSRLLRLGGVMRCALACIGMLALSVPSLASRPLPVMQPGRVAYVDEMSLDVPDGVSWLRVYKEFAPPSIRLQGVVCTSRC